MRVLQLIDSLNAGGAERMAVNIANEWANVGNASFLCATRKEGLLKDAISPKVKYLFPKKRSVHDIRAIWRLKRFVKKNRIDIIHAHATSFFTATLVKLIHPSIKIVWHDHYGQSEALDERPFKVLRWCSGFFSSICCVNDALALWNKNNLHTKVINCIPNFVLNNSMSSSILRLNGIDGKRLLCVANLRRQKDYVNLLKSFKQVSTLYPEWTLHCVGYDFKDPYALHIKTLVTDLGLESKVIFYGSRSDVQSFMQTCDIAVLSSSSEGLPLVLLEYGLNSMPVVATDVGDCHKIIRNRDTGLLIIPGNSDELAAALINLIKDASLRQELANNLKAHVRQEYGVEQAMKALTLVYSKALEKI